MIRTDEMAVKVKGSTHVVNLAGEPISTRWDENEERNHEQPEESDRSVVSAMANVKEKVSARFW